MASEPNKKKVHFLLFPLMAPGHMIPMVDMARLIARQEGVRVTIVTTPVNAERFSGVIARAREAEKLDVRVVELEFPSKEAGLPRGCENVDMLPSLGEATKFITATNLFREKAEKLFFDGDGDGDGDGDDDDDDDVHYRCRRPSCIISDMVFPWTNEVAKRFGVPRIVFHGTCCFAQLCTHFLRKSRVVESLASEADRFAVPGLDDEIVLSRDQLPNIFKASVPPDMRAAREKMVLAEEDSYGIVVNSFEELEPEYVAKYRREKHPRQKVWFVGPVSLCNRDYLDMMERGNHQTKVSSSDEVSSSSSSSSSSSDTTSATTTPAAVTRCLRWLEEREPGSVIYVCLGSLCPINPSQMIEVGLGLEASRSSFIWVIRGGHDDELREVEKWMEEYGFEERIANRGMIIRGWAPQVLILSQPAVGGFLTHCGWNSTLEGVCAGKPMVTWPMFADQFYDEKLVVQVLRIGVSVGVDTPVTWGDEEERSAVLVTREDLTRAVDDLMMADSTEAGRERKRRVEELAKMARKAVQQGGSSDLNLRSLIQDIRQLHHHHRHHQADT